MISSRLRPKWLASQPVIRPSLVTLASHPGIAVVQPVIHPDDVRRFEDAAAGLEVLVPVLGGPYGVTLQNGELRLNVSADGMVVTYHDHRFPVDPATWPVVFVSRSGVPR